MKHEAWVPAAREIGLELPEAAPELLDRYLELLVDRAAPLGMIAGADLPRIVPRHVLDALRGAVLMPDHAVSVCDLGSGAGLPGIPLAIARPSDAVTLVEARRNRAAFLELTVDSLHLEGVTVFIGRVEGVAGPFDVCLARAFAGPTETWRAARDLLAPGGSLLYWAGERFRPADVVDRDVSVTTVPNAGLAGSGPIVMMTRQ